MRDGFRWIGEGRRSSEGEGKRSRDAVRGKK